jgi:hypothetical protein
VQALGNSEDAVEIAFVKADALSSKEDVKVFFAFTQPNFPDAGSYGANVRNHHMSPSQGITDPCSKT